MSVEPVLLFSLLGFFFGALVGASSTDSNEVLETGEGEEPW